MSSIIVERLEASIQVFAAYEREVGPDQYEEALGTVRDLQAAFAEIRTPSSFIECALLSAEAPCAASVLMHRMVDLEFAREQADNVRLALAAYQPYGRSKAIRHLQARKHLVGQLRRLAEVSEKVLQAPGLLALPVVRPDYLQVVSANDVKEDEL